MKKKRFFQLLLVNSLGVLLLFLTAELLVRALVPQIKPHGTDASLYAESRYRTSAGLRPGAAGTSNGARLSIDSEGFHRYQRPRNPESSGWLFMGDSVTMGLGVVPDATFAGRIHHALDSINVLNTALIGYDVSDYGNIFEVLGLEKRRQYRIERVSLFLCLNDIHGHSTIAAEPGTRARELFGGLLDFLRRHVRSYLFLKGLFFDRSKSYYQFDRLHYEDAALVDAAVETMSALKELCLENGLQFDVVVLPYEYQLRPAVRDRYPQEVIGQRLRQAGVAVHDLWEAFATAGDVPASYYLYGDGIHLSEKGHELVAASYLSHLKAEHQ